MTINKNCNPFVKEKLLKGLSAKKWRTTTEIVALGGVHTNNIYANIGVLIREGVVETMMRGIPNGGNSRGCHRERVYRLTGNESVFEPTTGPAIIVIDPANHPQFYVDKVAAVLKKHYMEGKTVTVTVIEGDPSKEEEAGCE